MTLRARRFFEGQGREGGRPQSSGLFLSLHAAGNSGRGQTDFCQPLRHERGASICKKNVAAGAAAEKRTLLRSRHPCTPGIKHLHRLQDRIRQFRADSVMDLSLQAFQLDLRIAALLETLEQCYPNWN